MKASEVYLKAAIDVFDHDRIGLGLAILDAGSIEYGHGWSKQANRFHSLFGPFDRAQGLDVLLEMEKLSKDVRALALCFMAAIAESEGN